GLNSPLALTAGVAVATSWLVLRATDQAVDRLTRQFAAAQTRRSELDRQLILATKIRNDLAGRGRALSALRQAHPLPAHLLALTRQAPDGVVFTELRGQPAGDSRQPVQFRAKTARLPPANTPNQEAAAPAESIAATSERPPPLVVQMSGYAVDHDELMRLISALQRLPLWEQVVLLSATREPNDNGEVLAFRLECLQLASGPPSPSHRRDAGATPERPAGPVGRAGGHP
ncbi:unnamed protein product, partial [marine sediment metagenome]